MVTNTEKLMRLRAACWYFRADLIRKYQELVTRGDDLGAVEVTSIIDLFDVLLRENGIETEATIRGL